MSNGLESMSVDELQSYLSDFHKDFYGFRPRNATPEQWVSRDWLIERIEGIHDAIDNLKKTAEGREWLRNDGWQIDESEFV
jgi:hypothetical protein